MNVNDLADGRILYFPTIEFQSDGWVKSALCVWENLYRIVPASYTPQDSDEVKEAIDAGVIQSIIVNRDDLATTAVEFQKLIDKAPNFPAAIQGHDNIRIHSDKIDARIRPLMESLAKKIDPNGWLSVSQPVADAYMLFLAKTIASRRNLAEVTDNDDIFNAFTYFSYDGYADTWANISNASDTAASLVLPHLIPKGIETDSMKRVLQFRTQYEDERLRFRSNVETLAKNLAKVEDRDHATTLIKEYEEKILSKRASVGPNRSSQNYREAYLWVGLPIAVSAMIEHNNESFLGIATAACALALVGTLAHVAESARKKWKCSDAYYHLKMQQNFSGAAGSEGPFPRYRHTFHEFMDD